MKTILVTGSEGYIGSHTVKMLKEKGYNVIGFDKKDSWNNLLVPITIFNIFSENKIDCVMHFAGLLDVKDSMENPETFYNNNIIGTLNLLTIMRTFNVNNFIFSSSAAVYGNPGINTISEESETNPINNYGYSKLVIEQILESYFKAYEEFNYISLRYFNAAGADETGVIGEQHNPETHLIPIILDVALGKRESIKVFGTDYNTFDGTCIRDYIHVNDIARAHILAMEKISTISGQCINLGNGKGYSVLEIIKVCEEITKKNIKKEFVTKREGDPSTLVARYDKAIALLHWYPKYDIKQIIETAWKWHKKLNKVNENE